MTEIKTEAERVKRRYRASSPSDMRDLAGRVRALPEHRVNFAIEVQAAGIMRCQWWLRLAIWLGEKRTGLSRRESWQHIYGRWPELSDQLIDGLASHILIGRDGYDRKSVGGLAQQEVNAICDILETGATTYRDNGKPQTRSLLTRIKSERDGI